MGLGRYSVLLSRWTLLVTLIQVVSTSLGQLTDQDCLSFGFNRNSLKCPSCDLLPKFELDSLEDVCQQCCVEDNTIDEKKYAKALLEVCWCKFPTMPQIEAFVKGDSPKKFTNLKIKHVPGALPTIKMYNKEGEVEQTLSISKWDTDTIEEFLTTHLEGAGHYV
jgi:hypothetical protein